MSDSKKKDDHKIGYGKPPKETQFKKGTSGNPRGRPKGVKNMCTSLKRLYNQEVPIREGNKVHKMSILEVIVTKQLHNAMTGNTKAFTAVVSLAIRQGFFESESIDNRPLGGVLKVPGIADVDKWEESATKYWDEMKREMEDEEKE